MMEQKRKLFLSLIGKGLFSLIMVAVILFISAGSMAYLEAWVFLSVFAISAFSFGVWLYVSQPEQFLNRFRTEHNHIIQRITTGMSVVACAALIVAGLDKRYEWSYRMDLRFIFAALLLFFAILVYRNVFICNPFLSNTVEIHKGHKVVGEGMYRVIRHPMYFATICTCTAGLIILGSWMNLPLFLVFIGLIVLRIKEEEKLLFKALPDYTEYSKKVKYKLVPFIW